jgi:hypothetical protein
VSDLSIIHAHLESLRSGDANDPEHSYSLQLHVAEEWMEVAGLSRRQICDVVAAWLAFGFDSGRLTFDFGDLIANNLHWVAQAEASSGASSLTDFHTPLSWAVYLAFDAGEFTFDPDFDPVEGHTRPQIADIVRRIDELIEYPLALTGLRAAEPDATS